jgi:hypothetical protein
VAQFEPEWMFIDDLNVLSLGNPTIGKRLGLGIHNVKEMVETIEKAWDAQAKTLPHAIQLLRRLEGWCFLSQEDMACLMEALERLPADELHFPGEWEEVFYQHQTQHYDFAALLFESTL